MIALTLFSSFFNANQHGVIENRLYKLAFYITVILTMAANNNNFPVYFEFRWLTVFFRKRK